MHFKKWLSASFVLATGVKAASLKTRTETSTCYDKGCQNETGAEIFKRWPPAPSSGQRQLGLAVGNRAIIYAGAKIANDALDTILRILVRHDVIEDTTDESVRDIVGFCERSVIYGLAAKTGKDVAFYMGGIGLEAVNRRGDDGTTYSHDHWNLLDEHGNIDQGRYGDRAVLCNHTLAAILGKGGKQVTRLSEDDGVKLNHLIHYTDSNGTFHFQNRSERKENHVDKRSKTYRRFPLFDADGAGFKFLVKNYDPVSPSASWSDGAELAHKICQHYVYETRDKNYAFYTEYYTNGGWGHEVCLIAEAQGFGLNNEWPICVNGQDHVVDEL